MLFAHTYPRLLADVGGTNVRFALIRTPGARISDERNLVCADYPGLFEATKTYLDPLGVQPTWAAIGIATAIAGDFIKMTNHGWAFSQAELKTQLALRELSIINDFTALALSLPTLDDVELVKVGGGERNPDLPIALLGAGTGLGVSGLIPAHQPGEAPRWIPLQGEGGHVSFSPFNDKEDEILRILRREFGHVSAERLLSGPGLQNLYKALAELNSQPNENPSAADITQRAVAGTCTLCRETVDTFCAMLGSASANLAITLGARGGLYIGGGIVPRLGDYFANSPFRRRFEQKGRFSNYLAAVPSFVIVAKNPALRGTAAALDALATRQA
ncbi:glucokinase [Chitinimonas sp. BJB300]|uniref:glucokinase n=1 Tax=Chitinimonas sp. BJB300 TaxID=1559339 RepID=UPI000C0F5865|nr:glucokinase [Chitinimonas sp. BJB300]PHV11843.1 glucokinase [Chitinimonas sp. BJB300]TSJ88635.1 glucokinase [Chitinimonas sp. BJB300]